MAGTDATCCQIVQHSAPVAVCNLATTVNFQQLCAVKHYSHSVCPSGRNLTTETSSATRPHSPGDHCTSSQAGGSMVGLTKELLGEAGNAFQKGAVQGLQLLPLQVGP